ncbi:MAG: hypothetical protein AAF394_18835 [Planctomycetota bacterium]
MEDLVETFLGVWETDSFKLESFLAFCGSRCTRRQAREMLEDHPFVTEQGDGMWEIVADPELAE